MRVLRTLHISHTDYSIALCKTNYQKRINLGKWFVTLRLINRDVHVIALILNRTYI